jgi:hypothetical protein
MLAVGGGYSHVVDEDVLEGGVNSKLRQIVEDVTDPAAAINKAKL